jgi:hypothetical protein
MRGIILWLLGVPVVVIILAVSSYGCWACRSS